MTVRVSIALRLLLLILAAPAVSAESTIVVLGDSLSSGYGLRDAPSWVDLLQARIEQEAYEYRVVNASIPGDTSSGGLSRLPGLLERYAPRIVIIELGGNDGLRGLPVSLLRDNLAAIIDLVTASGAVPVLTGIQIPPNYGLAYTAQFTGIYPELADRFDIDFVEFLMDGVALDPSRMQADRIHPNESGQPGLLDNVWPVLAGVL
jgi:acyl-CoA thioesterase-1